MDKVNIMKVTLYLHKYRTCSTSSCLPFLAHKPRKLSLVEFDVRDMKCEFPFCAGGEAEAHPAVHHAVWWNNG